MITKNEHKEIPGNPSTAKSSIKKLRTEATNDSLRVLTIEDWKFWKNNGYIIIKNAVPREQALETAEFIWEFDDKDSKDPSTWYADARAEMQMKELAGTGMVEVYNNQHLWNNRQYQKVYDAFVDIWGTEKLWVTIDRANLNFPIRPGFEYKGFIHWDYDPDTKPQNVKTHFKPTYPNAIRKFTKNLQGISQPLSINHFFTLLIPFNFVRLLLINKWIVELLLMN